MIMERMKATPLSMNSIQLIDILITSALRNESPKKEEEKNRKLFNKYNPTLTVRFTVQFFRLRRTLCPCLDGISPFIFNMKIR